MNEQNLSITQRAKSSGLIKGPQLMLMLLANRQQEGWRFGDLTSACGMSGPLAHQVKKDLVERGLASEHYPTRDQRVVRVYLTDLGRSEADTLWAALTMLANIEEEWRSASPPDLSVKR